MSVGDIMTLRTKVAYGNILAISNLCFVSTSEDPTWDERVGDVFVEDIAPFYMAMCSPDASFIQYDIHTIVGLHPDHDHIDVDPPVAGGLGGAAAPGQVAAKITWYPEGMHRSQRGRTYIGGVANDQIADHRRLSDDVITLLNAFAAEMLATWGIDGTESTARFSILSTVLDGAPRAVPVGLPVIEWNPVSVIGTQRRRLL